MVSSVLRRSRSARTTVAAGVAILAVLPAALSHSPAFASKERLPTLRSVQSSSSTILGGPASALQVWAAANENPPPVDLASAVRAAGSHEVITALPGTYRNFVPAMKATNPRLRLFSYLNASYAQSNQGNAYTESWYAHDVAGQKIRSHGYGNYLMDVSSSGWRANRVAACKAAIASSGYDGCMLDMLGVAPLDPAYGTGVPVDVSTRTTYTPQAWLQATNGISAAVALGSGLPVAGNGGGNGLRYWNASAPTSILLGGSDLLIFEIWLQTAGQALTTFPPEAKWKAAVDQLVDAGARGKISLAMVKLWSDGTQTQKDRWHQFALASFLLGTDGRAMFNATYGRDLDATATSPWWQAPIGLPTGAYQVKQSIYTRQYSNGMVVVNTGSGTADVPLGGFFRTLDGQVVSSLHLVGQNGAVLVRV